MNILRNTNLNSRTVIAILCMCQVAHAGLSLRVEMPSIAVPATGAVEQPLSVFADVTDAPIRLASLNIPLSIQPNNSGVGLNGSINSTLLGNAFIAQVNTFGAEIVVNDFDLNSSVSLPIGSTKLFELGVVVESEASELLYVAEIVDNALFQMQQDVATSIQPDSIESAGVIRDLTELQIGESIEINGTLTVMNNTVLSLNGGELHVERLVLNGGTISGSHPLQLDETNGLSGTGTVSVPILSTNPSTRIDATGPLTLGDLSSVDGFRFAGTLNLGSNQVVLLDANEVLLGVETILEPGGRLVTANGASLPNGSEIVATGPALIDGNFRNNGIARGPSAPNEFLVFNDNVNGAGSYRGRIRFLQGFSPGNSPAIVTFDSDLTFGRQAELELEIAGTGDGEYDKIVVDGDVTINGNLQILHIDGYEGPAPGELTELTLMTANSLIGRFKSIEIGELELESNVLTHDMSGRFHQVRIETNGVSLKSYQAIPGDANGDGLFNTTDLVSIFVANEYEDDIDGNSDWTEGDWNGDKEFTTSDLILALQTATFEQVPIAAVPEPDLSWLLPISLLALLGINRTRRNTK